MKLKTFKIISYIANLDGDETECLPTDKDLHFVPMVQGAPGTGNHPDWDEPLAADWFYHILGKTI